MQDQKQSYITPAGVARYPHLDVPTAFPGSNAEPKFECGLILEGNALTKVKSDLSKLGSEWGLKKGFKLPIKEDKNGNEYFYAHAKRDYRPLIKDAKNNEVPEGKVVVGGGSKIRLGLTLKPYKAAFGQGITAYLNAVQVIDLKKGGSRVDFEALEDGFEMDEQDADARHFADGDDTDF